MSNNEVNYDYVIQVEAVTFCRLGSRQVKITMSISSDKIYTKSKKVTKKNNFKYSASVSTFLRKIPITLNESFCEYQT